MPLLLSSPSIASACAGDDPETAPLTEPSIDAEVCQHYQAGPYVDVTATLDTADAPDVSAEHTVHRVAFVELGAGGAGGAGGERGGFTKIAIDAAGDYVLYLDEDVPLAVEGPSGSTVAVESSCDPSACAADCSVVRVRHVVELGVGTHFLSYGPTAVSEASLVHEEAAHGEGK
jgi:hypothetical protein